MQQPHNCGWRGWPGWRSVGSALAVGVLIAVAGCASSQSEENYKELKRGPEPIQPEKDPMFGDASAFDDALETQPAQPAAVAPDQLAAADTDPSTPSAPASAPDSTPASASTSPAATSPATARADSQPAASMDSNSGSDSVIVVTVPASPQSPTLEGRDREHWSTTTFYAASGRVTHAPVYINTWIEPDNIDQVVTGPVEDRLEAALDDPDYTWMNATQLAHLVGEPALFYVQSLLLPVNVVRTPPTTTQVSP